MIIIIIINALCALQYGPPEPLDIKTPKPVEKNRKKVM